MSDSSGNFELKLAAPASLAAYNDFFAAAPLIARPKSVIVEVTTQVVWVTSGQPTIQLVVGRSAFTAASGAASPLDAAHVTKGTAVNLGPAAATTLGPGSGTGIFVFSPQDIADLQWYWPFAGVEIKFPSAPSAGVINVYFEGGRND